MEEYSSGLFKDFVLVYGRKGRLGYMANTLTFTSLIVVRQAPVICVMAPPIAWSMALMLWLYRELMERTRVCVVKAFLNVY